MLATQSIFIPVCAEFVREENTCSGGAHSAQVDVADPNGLFCKLQNYCGMVLSLYIFEGCGLRATDSIAGCDLRVTDCGLRATLRLRAAGHRLRAAGHTQIAGCGPQIAGCWLMCCGLQATDCGLWATCCGLLILLVAKLQVAKMSCCELLKLQVTVC